MPGTAEHGLDHPLHALFLQLVGELVQMYHPPLDKDFLGREDVILGDRAVVVPVLRVLESGFPAKGIHQPWLASSLRIYAFHCGGLKVLTGLVRVLAEQSLHFPTVEIAHAQRRGADIEWAADSDRLAGRR